MRVFCPNCGTENEGTPGSRVTCRACTASFEVPSETGPAAAAQPVAPSFGGKPVQVFEQQRATPQPVVVQPPPNVWQPGPPQGQFAPPPTASGATNTLAIVSLISSIVGCLCMPAFGSLAGIITGFIALSQINQANGAQKGRELAIGGIAVSFLGCLGWMGYFVLMAISGNR